MSEVLSKEEFEKYDDELNNILRDFHSAIFKIIGIASSIDPKNYYIVWVKQQIDLVRKIDKENIIKRCHEKFWYYREEICSHNLDFFNKNEFSRFIKNDDNKSFMYGFVNMLKKKVNDLSEDQTNIIWNLLEKILETCIRYKKLIGDYY